MRIGYGRIYPSDPDPEKQHEILASNDCEVIYIDDARETGAAQPQLIETLKCLKADDTLVVASLDRLARNPTDLVNHVTAIDECDCHLHILNQKIHTGKDPERIFLRAIAALKDVNTTGRSQRTRAGIANATATGKHPGRPKIRPSKVEKILKKLIFEQDEHGNRRYTITEIARHAQVSRATVYRYMDLFNITP